MLHMKDSRPIYCVECNQEVPANLVSGRDVYPHRPDLYNLMFWRCPYCGNFVGTHKKTGIPLGCIPNPELKRLRHRIHEILDPLWKYNIINRAELYSIMATKLGKPYHTAEIRSIEEAHQVIDILNGLIYANYSELYFWNGEYYVFNS